MKNLKKISLVYTLQVLAVILLFAYKGKNPEEPTTSLLKSDILPLHTGKAFVQFFRNSSSHAEAVHTTNRYFKKQPE